MENILLECVGWLNELFSPQANAVKWLERGAVKFRPPRVNFLAWLRGEAGAAYTVWREHYLAEVRSATTSDRVWRHIKPTAPRGLALAARCAQHWRRRVALAKLPPLAGGAAASSPPGGWLTPLLHASLNPRCYLTGQEGCLKLLMNLCFDTTAPHHAALTNRVADGLHFLATHCVPRLAHLMRANRGSGLSDEKSACAMSSLVMQMWMLASPAHAKALEELSRRTRRSSTSSVFTPSRPDAASDSLSPPLLRPLLLYRGGFLDIVEVLLQRTLASLAAVDDAAGALPLLRNWTDCLPAQMAPASGSSAAPGSSPGYVLMHISDLLALLQPLVSCCFLLITALL